MRKEHGLGEDLIKGAIAGAVATWVMGKVTNTMYQREDRGARRQEDDARRGEDRLRRRRRESRRVAGQARAKSR